MSTSVGLCVLLGLTAIGAGDQSPVISFLHPDPAAPLENHVAIRLAVKGGWVGDPDDPKWDAFTPAATANIIERNFIDAGWPVGVYESRSARGNVIANNHLGAKEPLIRRSEPQPGGD